MKYLAASLALMVVVGIACSSNKSGTTTGTPAGPAECKVDDDCVVRETGCCDHCNGGKAEAFPKGAPAPARPSCPAGVGCTRLMCAPALPRCDGGKCEVELGHL